MSYRHTLEAALESLHEIEDLFRSFQYEDTIPAIELDLGLQKLRNVYELLLMMKAPADERSATQSAVSAPQAAVAAVQPAVVAPQPVVSSPQAIVAAPVPPVTVHAGDVDKEQTLSDRFRGRATLHETLHQTMGKDSGTLGSTKVVSNLMKAIGINDRYTFVRELFNNDAKAFETAIDTLNEAASFNDAYNHMIRYFNWDMDSAAVQQLLEIIRRKYITNRHE